MGLNWRRALTYLGADVDAKQKLTITSVVGMLPFINVIILGYGVEIYRGVVSGKKDEDIQPEWSNVGDFALKGILAAIIALGYVIVGMLFSLLIGLLFGSSAFIQLFTGGTTHVSIFLKFLVALVFYGVSVFFWAGFSLYCESVVVTRAFRIGEVALRVQALGKDFWFGVAAWCSVNYVISLFTGILPVPFLGTCLCILFMSYSILIMVHILAQLSVIRIKPVLGDVVNVGYMEYSLKNRAAAAAHEDEFGYSKQGGRKASHYADHRPDTTLTWSTDSDNPLDE